MRTIFKYPLIATDDQIVMVKSPAIVRSVQMQGEKLCLWAEVNTEGADYPLHICIRGTGHPMKGNEGDFIGTVQMDSLGLVFHIFEAAK